DLVFGTAARPVVCGFDVHIGDGQVLPEVNFTLPAILIEAATWPAVLAPYDEIAKAILRRAAALRVPGIVLEFQFLPALPATPAWGAETTGLLKKHMGAAHSAFGRRSALRVNTDRYRR